MNQIKDYILDKKLHIKTGGVQPLAEATIHYHRYEPTPYHALNQLFSLYPLTKKDRIVDFGCGKGRLNIYGYDVFGCGGVGVEMNGDIYQQAMNNLMAYNQYVKNTEENVMFTCEFAQDYMIQDHDNYFYFFNPFSVQIFRQVIDNIKRSVENCPRNIKVILYYPDKEYVDFLSGEPQFSLEQEIILPEHKKDIYEKFLIYTILL